MIPFSSGLPSSERMAVFKRAATNADFDVNTCRKKYVCEESEKVSNKESNVYV